MNRRLFFVALASGLWLTHGSLSTAQQRIRRIGFLSYCVSSFDEQGFKQGLRELGYIEGKNIQIEWRRHLENAQELQPAADELVRSKVDILVTCGSPAARAALAATKTTPVVFTTGDPVSSGFVASLANPGANATGVSILGPELAAKRLDLLRQLSPRVQRVALISNIANPGSAPALKNLQAAAKTLQIKVESYNARNALELDSALRAIRWKSIDGVMVGADAGLVLSQGAKIAQAIRKARLPAVFPWRQFHEYGVVMSYGPDSRELMRRGAQYVDKILKGANPADLPVEQVSKVDLVIDLRVAHELGITVPPELLYRADEVIR